MEGHDNRGAKLGAALDEPAPMTQPSRLLEPLGWRDAIEILLVGLAFGLYFAVRSAVVGKADVAYTNALDIIDLQRQLGVFWEDDMNRWVGERLAWGQAANHVYFWLLFPLMIVFALWFYYCRREKYMLMRDTFLASGASSLSKPDSSQGTRICVMLAVLRS